MDSRAVAAVVSSLTSNLVSLLLLLLLSLPNNPNPNPLSLLLLLLSSSSHAAAAASLSLRKRKRTHFPSGPESVQLPRVDPFRLCFKMNRSTFEWLANLLEPLLDCRDRFGIPVQTRLGIGLYRLRTGSGFAEVSNRFDVSEPVARFCTKQLCRVLCTDFRFWVGFRSPGESLSLSQIPNCCGVISTTTFRLSKNDETRRDRIKAQIVVDDSCRILSIFAGFYSDRSDSTILKRSALYKDVEEGRVLGGPCVYIDDVAIPRFLIGDGEYPLLPWLITPFFEPLKGSCEDGFNSEMGSFRGSSIRAIASLKDWGVLSKPIEGGIKDVVAYIGACSILHNGLLMREDYSGLSDEVASFEEFKGRSFEEGSDGNEGSVIRRALATRDRGDS